MRTERWPVKLVHFHYDKISVRKDEDVGRVLGHIFDTGNVKIVLLNELSKRYLILHLQARVRVLYD